MRSLHLITMIFIWSVITVAVIYSIILKLKGRRQYADMRDAAMREQGEDFDPEQYPPQKTLLKAIATSKETWKTLFWAFTTAGFMMFIVEETMQIRGFGRYGLQQAKLWDEAARACNYSVEAVKRDRSIIKLLSFLNPPAGYVFTRYVDAEEKKLVWEMQRIDKELGKLNSRVTLIEGKLEVKPIEVAHDKGPDLPAGIGKVDATPSRPVFPIAQADGGLAYPRQIDYTTHAERVSRAQPFVYVTKYGRKFHTIKCRSVTGRQGVVKLSRTEALADNKEPCLRCKP